MASVWEITSTESLITSMRNMGVMRLWGCFGVNWAYRTESNSLNFSALITQTLNTSNSMDTNIEIKSITADVVVLDYASGSVDFIELPIGVKESEDIEDYLTETLGYRMSDIY